MTILACLTVINSHQVQNEPDNVTASDKFQIMKNGCDVLLSTTTIGMKDIDDTGYHNSRSFHICLLDFARTSRILNKEYKQTN